VVETFYSQGVNFGGGFAPASGTFYNYYRAAGGMTPQPWLAIFVSGGRNPDTNFPYVQGYLYRET
jgi:hypothetical protein